MHPVVLLSVDSLRFDRATEACLGESLPILNEDFCRFENAYSHGVATPFAFPGIVAGVHPEGNGRIPDSATTLAEGIPGRSTAYANNGHLHEERGYTRGFDRFEQHPSVDGQGGISLVDRVARRLQRIESIREARLPKAIYNRYLREPLPISSLPADGMTTILRDHLEGGPEAFVWGHYMDPHLPYHPEMAVDPPADVPSLEELEDVKERIAAGDADALTDDELATARELYDGNVRYFDRHFASLLRWLRERPWYDDAFVAVVSDHGELFGEHGLLFHNWDIDPHDEVAHTPLWVKYPGGEDAGASYDHVVGHGDVLATVADVLEGTALDPPEHTAPLRRASGRHVVTVSNTVKRLTEDGGSRFVRRDGTAETRGAVSDEGAAFVESLAFPECRNSVGEAMGVEEAERQRRLKNLGYR
ncbi:sulfatase-like hydrolase/transferase [Natronococcus jeotgali]|uniref:Arylsulfatase A family protein n=1 Tax=Natronococcus jeotgali DSM 18795 TaxID=1227498 RepID=L9X4R0_9EURY|nr:sulfatase-like hydrolase/transferase [Natronococcus jeotgali]ELY56597.1 arylsulfatase A family protein [Natronococcus jeotgali DSM 18795]